MSSLRRLNVRFPKLKNKKEKTKKVDQRVESLDSYKRRFVQVVKIKTFSYGKNCFGKV